MSGKARSGRGSGSGGRGSGSGGRGRHHPYEKSGQEMERETDESAEFETPTNSIKVSGTSDPRDLAKDICKSIRSGDEPPALLTIGNNSINQAVKGIAVARAELNLEGIDIAFQPAFRHVNRTRPLIAFYLSQVRPRKNTKEESELTVGSNSKIIGVAGAISGRIREGSYVVVSAIGVDAVTNAVLAAGNARLFLEQDSLDVKVQPEFFKINKAGSELNGLKFRFLSESI